MKVAGPMSAAQRDTQVERSRGKESLAMSHPPASEAMRGLVTLRLFGSPRPRTAKRENLTRKSWSTCCLRSLRPQPEQLVRRR